MITDYCREIETYLCRKNDGHLIRVVGPSFEIVSRWAEQGVPLKVAFAGIDRYFERYYRNGPRRRPVKIDFCEADVLDVFDEWRRATGIRSSPTEASSGDSDATPASPRQQSLPRHLERVVARLTSARATGMLDESFDPLIDRAAAELDAARAGGGVRGAARQALVGRLDALDAELMAHARGATDAATLHALRREADAELAPFRGGLAGEALTRAHDRALDRLVRERLGLPTIAYE